MHLKVKQICTTLVLAIGLISILIIWLIPNQQLAYAAAGNVYCVVPDGGMPGPFDLCDRVFTTVQRAVDAAGGGEEIWVAGSVYTHVSQRMGITQAVYISQTLTIRGGYTTPFTAVADPIANPTTLDPQGQGRVLSIANAGVRVTIENLRLTGGGMPNLQAIIDGGGILNQGSLRMNNVIVSGNYVQFGGQGGGIFNMGALTMTNSAVSNNSTGAHFGSGGGIYNQGSLTIISSTINGNNVFEASGGGGIFNTGTLIIRNSNVHNNSNAGFFGPGGGISNAGILSMTHTTVSNNHAASPGGGIHNHGEAILTIANSTIDRNGAAYGGGGIYNSGALTVTNTTISSNTTIFSSCCGVPIGGSGILNNGTLALSFTTIAANSANEAGFNGGGINNQGQAEFGNTIIAGNITVGGDDDCSNTGSLTSLGYNLVAVGTGCPTLGTDKTVNPADIFVTVLGPLHDNGGDTETHALLPGSPAIDAADNRTCPATDQRGRPRPVDGDNDSTAVCDIGAFELQRNFYFPVILKN
jgi:hypothetical protein